MSNENILDFYEPLGFEEIEIEDELTALSIELDTIGSYALITDEEGLMPSSPKNPVVFAYYTPEGAFQWSVTFKNSQKFKDIWTEAPSLEAKLTALQRFGKII